MECVWGLVCGGMQFGIHKNTLVREPAPYRHQPLHITCSLQIPHLSDDVPGFMIKVLSHTYPVVLRGSLECPKLSFETTQALEKVHPQRGWEAAFPLRYHRKFFSQD